MQALCRFVLALVVENAQGHVIGKEPNDEGAGVPISERVRQWRLIGLGQPTPDT